MEEAIKSPDGRYKRKKTMKYLTPLLGWVFPIVLFPVVLLLMVVFLVRLPWYRRHESRFIDKRDKLPNGYNRLSMDVEFSGIKSWLVGWDVEFSGDGNHEHETKISYWFFGTVWFTINNLFPKRWAPDRKTSNGNIEPWGTREYGFRIHNNTTWFRWWADTGGMGDQGYSWSVDFAQMIFGKIIHKEEIWGYSYHKISMNEGNYPCVVICNEVTRGRSRWFKKNYFSYDVVYGDFDENILHHSGIALALDDNGVFDYHYNKKLSIRKFDRRAYVSSVDPIEENQKTYTDIVGVVLNNGDTLFNKDIFATLNNKGIPAPGKGTAGYNCEDTALYSWSGVAKDPYDAALMAQNSIQNHRKNYGGETWVPKNEKYWEYKPKS